jgi:ceramide glucosyltransferase
MVVLTAILLAWTASYAFVAALVASRRARTPSAAMRDQTVVQTVLLVRPVTGDAPAIVEAMSTLPRTAPGLSVRWVAAVANADDPAWPVACRAAATLRAAGIDADAILTGARGPNRKAEQLAVATAANDGDVIVVIDADVDLASVDLAALIAPLDGSAGGRPIGVAWSPPIEIRAVTLGDRISRAILGGSWQAFAVLSRLDPRLLVGKCFAMRREVLDAIGGFAALRLHLGEDFELARRVDAGGWALHCTAHPVRSLASGRTVADVIDRYARWLWVVRAQRPLRLLAYPLWLAAAPLLVLAGLGMLGVDAAMGAAILGTTLATRGAVAVMATRAGGLPLRGGLGIDVWLADLAVLWALVRVVGSREVRWADRTLRLGEDGRLEPGPEPAHDPPRSGG